MKLHWYDGGFQPERPDDLELDRTMESGGTLFVGDKGKLMAGSYSGSPRLIPETAMQAYKRPPKTLPRITTSHQQVWIDAIKGGTQASSGFDYAGPFTETVLLGNVAARFPGQKLDWDSANVRVTNFAEANQFVQHQYRPGWSL